LESYGASSSGDEQNTKPARHGLRKKNFISEDGDTSDSEL